MKGYIRRRPEAEEDLVRQARYYRETADDETAARFLDAAEATLERLAAMPHMGRPWLSAEARLRGVRVFAMHGFGRHLVFYRPLEKKKGIEVLHVLHSSQDVATILEGKDK